MKILHTKNTTFTSYDRTISITTLHQRPDRIRMLEENISHQQIPRGGGLSYSPASFGENILVRELSSFNRILEFDMEQKTIIVEAGITLRKLLEHSFKERLFFPVLPGHPEITVGGCIAANVHGKNPLKDGTFKEHVIWIELFHPKGGTKIVEPNSEIFNATCGGLGLTGIITKAKLQLYELPSDRIIVEPKNVESVIESIGIFEKNPNADVLYGWHNGSILRNFGRGITTIGTFAKGFKYDSITIQNKPTKQIQIPFSLWGKLSTSLFFSTYRNIQLRHGKTEKNVFESFFPLTGIARWFITLYGKRGFREYQCIISRNNVKDFISDLTKLVKKDRPDLNIISAKPFRGEQKFLQFCRDGISIVLDFPNSSSTNRFFPKIDELVMAYDAIPNIIKDSRLPRKVVERCYPQFEEFRDIIKKNDPDRVFRSYISQQLGL